MRITILLLAIVLVALHRVPALANTVNYFSGQLPAGQSLTAGSPSDLPIAQLSTDTFPTRRSVAALRSVNTAARLATRGAKEVKIYREMSPSVVLILTSDALGSGSLIKIR